MSASNNPEYTEEDKRILLDTALRSIEHGLDHGHALQISVENYNAALQAKRATFVTINKEGQLRGCIGTLNAHQPLIRDVSDNAWSAAFRDPRFMPVTRDELGLLEIHISILSPPEEIYFSDEEDLIRQLQPGVDGLILEAGGRRGTFLPSVWESLAEPRDFLQHLKQKAGLPASYWGDDVKVSRYTAQYI